MTSDERDPKLNQQRAAEAARVVKRTVIRVPPFEGWMGRCYRHLVRRQSQIGIRPFRGSLTLRAAGMFRDMSTPAPLGYRHAPPRPSRWRKIVLLIVATLALAWGLQYASRLIAQEWNDAARRRADARLQSALATYHPPANVLVWSNDPADQTPERRKALGPSYVLRPKGVLLHLPPPELANAQLLRMMPLAVRKETGSRVIDNQTFINTTWFAAISLDMDWFPALTSHGSSTTATHHRLPEPLYSAKTLRFWTATPPANEESDRIARVEADGKRYKLIRSWQSGELRVEE